MVADRVSRAPQPRPGPPVRGRAALPVELVDARADFLRHLRLELDRSAHTARAYDNDITSLFEHLVASGGSALADLNLGVLRGWLARLRAEGAARSTLARRSAGARTFTAWAHAIGRMDTDPGLLLASARPRRALPPVLAVDEAIRLLEPPAP
ncbi:MAG: site-specific integrase, partial [Actinomycetia bacterium]|nr:site-specific integrase [Actinomycetes bacterium]